MPEWRAGRSTGRTLWRDEVLVGMVDSPEIALEIVGAMRAVTRLLDGEPESGRERSLPLLPDVQAIERPECCCAGCIGMGPCDDDLGTSDDEDADDHPVDCGCAVCLQERDELFT